MTKLFLDYETWSSVPIRRGTDVYLDNAEALLLTYAFDDEKVRCRDYTEESLLLPPDVAAAVKDPSVTFVAHNSFFDRNVTRKCLGIDIPHHRWHCTFAQAMSHSLPGGLGPLCNILGVAEDQSKIADGMRLIRKFCGPKPLVKDSDWLLFIEYAMRDTESMRQCYKRMPNWNYIGTEKELWNVDQIINDRGFAIDQQFATAAIKALTTEKERLADATNQATGGAVTAATQRDKLLMFLCEKQGCFLPDLKAATIAAALEDESLEESTRHLLKIRLDSSKSSNSKFKRLSDSVGKGGRLRGTLQYAGAPRTSRWAGRIFQPHNLPRPTMHAADIRNCIDLVRTGRHHLVLLFGRLNEACSNGLRGLIVAEEGNTLAVADYSSIEGRGLAWVAGEDWKIKAYRNNEDLYCRTIERSLGLPVGSITKKDIRRQWGKVQELALGYGGGVGAFVNMAGAYSMDLDELGRVVPENAPLDVMDKARVAWDRAVNDNMTYSLTKEAYVACDALKIMYRRANPEIVKFWYMLEEAARRVILAEDKTIKVHVGPITFDCNGKWLRIKLPSGRFLCYALPRIHNSGTISYMAWRNKQWSRTKTYGGKLAENIVQAISRDILGCALLALHANGFPVVLHVHDEIIAEVVKGGKLTLEAMVKIMTTNPSWARGFPLGAEGFEKERYEK